MQTSDPPLADLIDAVDPAPWLALLEERFGIPSRVFDPYILFRRSGKYLALVPHGHRPPAHPTPEVTGLPFLRVQLRYPKLTTAAAQLFGAQAVKNVAPLTRVQADAFLARQTFPLSDEQTTRCTGTGYVLARYGETTLGVGFYREGGGTLRSLFPKALARDSSAG